MWKNKAFNLAPLEAESDFQNNYKSISKIGVFRPSFGVLEAHPCL